MTRPVPIPSVLPLLFLIAALCLPLQAHALACTLSPTGWSLTYDPFSALAATTTSSVSVTCTRQAGDPKSVTLAVAADSGLHASGTINQAMLSNNALQYNNYTNAAYTLVWGTGGSTLSVPLTFGTGAGASASATIPFYASIPAGQISAPAGGTTSPYTDSVGITLKNGTTVIASSSFSVSVTINPACAFTTPPGAINLNYTSLQTVSATASTSFAARCTNTLPYTLSLDATTGTLLGLTYTLVVPAGTFTGTGVAQSYTINSAIAPGQAGTCATATCTGSVTHSVTITY